MIFYYKIRPISNPGFDVFAGTDFEIIKGKIKVALN
jgi:hypothetical protein